MYPGRWNRKGQRAVYTSTSRALALNEVLAHLPKNSLPTGYSLLTMVLRPGDIVYRRSLSAAQKWFGTVGRVLSEDSGDPIALIVPSVIVPEYNVVLYPRPRNFEPEFVQIAALDPFEFDSRLFDEMAAPRK